MREGRLTALCLATFLAGAPLAHAADASCSYPKLPYPTPVSSFMPYDVDYAKKKELEGKKQFADVQRLFDILSWQTFIALNWPVGPDGKPRASLSDKGPRLWEGWKESFEVFRDDGRRPAPWGAGGELSKLVSLSPLFNNPALPAAPVNVQPPVWKTVTDACGNTSPQWDPAYKTPVQVTRTIIRARPP